MSKNTCCKLSVHTEHELLLKLEKAGLGEAEAQKVIQSKGGQLAKKIVVLIRGESITLADWQDFYRKIFGIEIDLSGLHIPDAKTDFDRVIVIVKSLALNQVFKACKDYFPSYSYHKDLDEAVTKNDRTADKTYTIRIRDRVEADDELKNFSANDLKEKGIKGITLLERLVLELKYFDETGRHMDISNLTLCSGSRDSNGKVLSVRWLIDGFGFCVGWSSPSDSYSDLRTRAVVC